MRFRRLAVTSILIGSGVVLLVGCTGSINDVRGASANGASAGLAASAGGSQSPAGGGNSGVSQVPSSSSQGGAAAVGGVTGSSASGGISSTSGAASGCTKDTDFPRRITRLSEREYLNGVKALAAIDDAAIPASFQKASIGETPDGNQSVTRNFEHDADILASLAAEKLALAPEVQSCAPNFGADSACTKQVLQSLGAKILRGPVDADTLAQLSKLASDAALRSDPSASLKLAIRAMLLSPRALYTTEGVVKDDGTYGESNGVLSKLELASYVSYRAKEGPPSAALLDALGANDARTPQGLSRILNTVLGGGFVESATLRFLAAWLGTPGISRLTLDTSKHPDVDSTYLARLESETLAALGKVAQDQSLTLRGLLTNAYESTVAADARTGLLGSVGRSGVFSLPGVIAAASGNTETNIPRRGRFILKNLFCETLGNPPPGAVNQAPPVPPTATQRERFARVEASGGACTGCHSRIDGLALPYERYDELGRMRLQDEHGNALDPTGSHLLLDGTLMTYQNAADLMVQSASIETVRKCVVTQVFRNLNRRDKRGSEDQCLLDDAANDVRADGFPVQRLMIAVLVRSALARRSGM